MTDEMKALIEVEQDPDWPDADRYAVSRGGRYWMGLSEEDARGLCRALNALFGIRQPSVLSPLPDEQLNGAITRVEGDINRVPPNAETARTIADIRTLLAEVRRLRAQPERAPSRDLLTEDITRFLLAEFGQPVAWVEDELGTPQEWISVVGDARKIAEALVGRFDRALSSHPDEESTGVRRPSPATVEAVEQAAHGEALARIAGSDRGADLDDSYVSGFRAAARWAAEHWIAIEPLSGDAARIRVDHDESLSSFPIAERVRGGWQSGVHFYPDVQVTVLRRFAFPAPVVSEESAELRARIERAREAWWSATEQGDSGLVYTDRIEDAMDAIWDEIGHADWTPVTRPDEETVTTVEELDALPEGSVIREDGSQGRIWVFEKDADDEWATPGAVNYITPLLPARVLFRPTPEGSER